MGKNKFEGTILLERFELNDEEMLVAKNIVGKYAEKINNITDSVQIKLEMKVHQKDKNKHFEIKGRVDHKDGKATSEKQDSNPFVAIDGVMEKLLNEIKHTEGKKQK
jgi:ribosome-associated translation inhibitor RaiA